MSEPQGTPPGLPGKSPVSPLDYSFFRYPALLGELSLVSVLLGEVGCFLLNVLFSFLGVSMVVSRQEALGGQPEGVEGGRGKGSCVCQHCIPF